MPRRVSLKNPVCICCNTNRCRDKRDSFCINCKNFIYIKLHLSSGYVSDKLHNTMKDVRTYENKNCSFCEKIGVISYKHFKLKKRYYLCQEHHDRWLKIGCELSEFVKLL